MPKNGVVTKLEHIQHLSFDGIFSNNLLEHLRHPADELRQMASLLKAWLVDVPRDAMLRLQV